METMQKNGIQFLAKMRFLFCDRSTFTLLLSLLLVGFIGYVNSRMVAGEQRFEKKRDWKNVADLVVLGDSRVDQGVSPEQMKSTLPGYRILNCGFNGMRYTSGVFDFVESLFASEGPQKILVMELDARNCDRVWDVPFGTSDEKETFSLGKLKASFFAWTQPFDLEELDVLHFRKANPQVSHEDGWLEVTYNASAQSKRYFAANFFPTVISPTDIFFQGLKTRLQALAQRQVHLYAFIPPVEAEMEPAQKETLARLQAETRAVGVIWLDFQVERYPTYDSVHMPKESALLFSRDLAEQIRFQEEHLKIGF